MGPIFDRNKRFVNYVYLPTEEYEALKESWKNK